MEPVIRFKGYSIEDLKYSKGSNDFEKSLNIQDNIGLNLSVSCGITEDLQNGNVIIDVKFREEERNLNIQLKVKGYFEINDIPDVKEIQTFLSVNGTAIVYPYVRSIISMVSSLDYENAIVLPTINTNMFAE